MWCGNIAWNIRNRISDEGASGVAGVLHARSDGAALHDLQCDRSQADAASTDIPDRRGT